MYTACMLYLRSVGLCLEHVYSVGFISFLYHHLHRANAQRVCGPTPSNSLHRHIKFSKTLAKLEIKGTRDENKENNLADKVADNLFFYQTNEKITGQEIKKTVKRVVYLHFHKMKKKMS